MFKKRIFIILLIIALLLSSSSFASSISVNINGKNDKTLFKNALFNKLFNCFFSNSRKRIVPFPQIEPVSSNGSILLILIEFSDVVHYPSHDTDYFNRMLFGQKPSVKDYYKEVSYDKFSFTNGTILGWYKSSHSITERSRDGIVSEALRKAAKNRSVDFASYDKNGDKILSANELSVIICTSGYSLNKPMGAYHNWRLWGIGSKTWDGLDFSGEHSVVQEWHNWMVWAHELGHSLQLPDLYDDTRRSVGIGSYGIMGGGNLDGANGHHFTAWSKIKLGWIEPTIITQDGFYYVNNSEENPEAYILCDKIHSKTEYFLVENRFRGNSYDNGGNPLPDEGIIIYHVDDSVPKWFTPWTWFPGVNNIERHKMVDVECADSFSSHFNNADDLDKNKNRGDETDLWDNSCYGFNSTSTPCNSRWYDGSSSDIGIYVLSPPGESMLVYFSVNGTTPCGDIND